MDPPPTKIIAERVLMDALCQVEEQHLLNGDADQSCVIE